MTECLTRTVFVEGSVRRSTDIANLIQSEKDFCFVANDFEMNVAIVWVTSKWTSLSCTECNLALKSNNSLCDGSSPAPLTSVKIGALPCSREPSYSHSGYPWLDQSWEGALTETRTLKNTFRVSAKTTKQVSSNSQMALNTFLMKSEKPYIHIHICQFSAFKSKVFPCWFNH